jgi:hypothetical protein
MSVRLAVRMQQLHSHRKKFHEIWYLSFFRKHVEKVLVSLKSDKINVLYAFFWLIPRRLNFICRRFETLCSIFIGR